MKVCLKETLTNWNVIGSQKPNKYFNPILFLSTSSRVNIGIGRHERGWKPQLQWDDEPFEPHEIQYHTLPTNGS